MQTHFPTCVGVQVGLLDTRFIVTESVDTSITICAELQEGFLGRNITLMVVNTDSNGRQKLCWLMLLAYHLTMISNAKSLVNIEHQKIQYMGGVCVWGGGGGIVRIEECVTLRVRHLYRRPGKSL